MLFSILTCVTDGDHDWMDPEGGKESVERMRQAGNGFGRMYMIPHAGHHGALSSFRAGDRTGLSPTITSPVYLDNPKAMNDLLVKELDRAADPSRTSYSP